MGMPPGHLAVLVWIGVVRLPGSHSRQLFCILIPIQALIWFLLLQFA